MKELLLQIAGVKTEAEFYKKFPDKETFFKAHPEAQEIIAQYQQQEMMANAPENSQEQMMGTQEEMLEQMAMGGMIKRKDGSYSKRGLWDNIRANKGSGKKPTKQMLEAAKKIQAEEMMYGGNVEEYANGGDTNNFLFKNLPIAEQQDILSKMVIKGKTLPFNPRLALNTFVAPRFGEDFVRGSINPMYYDKNFSFGPYFDGYADLEGAKINNYGIRGAVNLNDRLSINTDLNPNAINAGMRLNFANGGGINNPGFKSLPKEVQENIIANMSMGGEVEEYKNGGYTVRRSNDRKGKTHVVTGPDGTKKYFGDPKLGERSKSKYGKDAFYARHAKNLKNNPYFRAYARSTWANGGIIPEMEELMMAGDYYNMGGYVEYPTNYPGGGMIAGPMMGYEDDEFMYAMGGGININPANKGKFTEWAASRGMGVQEAANKVMANKNKYSTDVVQMANFAKNAAKWKKQDGGDINALNTLYNKMPVQTESYQGQPEQVVLPDGTIESVNATQSHENMSDNQITDVLPTGSHIQSSRNKLTPSQYQQLIDMFTPEVAKERMEQIAQITKGKNKKISPAEISEYAKNKYQTKSTPNSFDTNKLKESNKQSFVDLSIQMNDLIKAGKELTEEALPEKMMMAYGGMVNKYQDGTGFTGANPDVAKILPYIIRSKGGKPRLNLPDNLSVADKIELTKQANLYGIGNVIQSMSKEYPSFGEDYPPQEFEKRIVFENEGLQGLQNQSESDIRKKAFNYLGYTGIKDDKTLSDAKLIYNNPENRKSFYEKFKAYLPEGTYRPIMGNDDKWAAEHYNAIKKSIKPDAVVTPETPGKKADDLELARINAVAGARQMPMQNRFNYGLLEGQLGRGLSANEAYLNASMDLNPLYIMETPDTYIRSRKNEIPVGNILYNIEKAQRNAANALANETGDWSTLAGNIANAGATAMNQVGNTLSALNEKNVGLYNTTQGLQQGLLGENIDVRNQNLTNAQNMANFKRNLFGQKAVKDAELYAKYASSMGQNAQQEQNQKLELLNIMAAKPDMFKGEQGQRFANQIMGNYGSYNNAFAGSPLDFIFNNINRLN